MILIAYVARPFILKLIAKTPTGELVGEGCFVTVMVAALMAAFITEFIGLHPIPGPLLLGLSLPGGMPLGVTLTERLDSFLSSLFLPLYLVLAWYRIDFTTFHSFASIGYITFVCFVAYITKLFGAMVSAFHFKMTMKDALTLGLIFNIKGIVEVSFFNSWGEDEVATAQHFRC